MKITTDGFGLDICYIKLKKAYKLADDKPITMAEDAVNALSEVLKDLDREVMCVITLKTDGFPLEKRKWYTTSITHMQERSRM